MLSGRRRVVLLAVALLLVALLSGRRRVALLAVPRILRLLRARTTPQRLLAVREWAYVERAVDRLVSAIAPANVRSQRLAERLGATPGETVSLFDGGPHVLWQHPR